MSSGSESDEEYIPEEPGKVSEEESAEDETELQFEKEQERKSIKRKSVHQRKGKKKSKTTRCADTIDQTNEEQIKADEVLNPEEEKKREDDLWAKFLEGTDTKPKPTVVDKITNAAPSGNTSVTPNKNVTCTKTDKEESKERERRIFEFAGETIVVENNVIKEKIKSTESQTLGDKDVGPSRARGGLSDVLGQLNKKNKISTLEKSKLDWSTYKQEEGIEEEIQSHNKGKEGYLDRQDFLERADLRQYEIERDLRLKRRSNR